MRLTLRTLLAFQDDVLEPADMEEIRQKVEASEFASALADRIRDVTRRLRLRAPKIMGRGMGLDPNTVAEYLDNTLAAERVPNFEKVCLESDVHLAEVAACHQILTLVLGEPADVVSESRQRMYRILKENPAAIAQETYAMKAAPGAEEVRPRPISRDQREKPEIPDYLRDESSWRGRLASSAVLLLLVGSLAAVVYLAVFAPGSSMFFDGDNGERVAREANQDDEEVTVDPADEAASPDARGKPGEEIEPGERPTVSDVAPPPAVRDDGASPPPVVSETVEPSSEVEPQPEEPIPGVFGPSPTERPTPEDAPSDESPNEDSSPDLEAPPFPEDADNDPMPPVPDEPQIATPVGRYVGGPGVLLRVEPGSDDLDRLSQNDNVMAGQLLTSLPTYRSTLELSNGLSLTLLGDTGMTFEHAQADVPVITLAYGRAVIAAARGDGLSSELQLRLPGREGTLRFSGADAAAAVEVRPHRIEGTDPEDVLPLVAVAVYAVSGQISWQDAGESAAKEIQAPAVWNLTGDPQVNWQVDVPQPSWVGGFEDLSEFDRLASEALLLELRPDRPLMLNLKELAVHRRIEIRSLAVRCLASLGEFEPIITALGESSPEAVWGGHVAKLRSALADGPKMAAHVRATLEQHRRDDAAEFYRLLWGYSDAQLAAGDDRRLVDYLDHPDLDIRVLAFWNLKEITGAGLSYRPDSPPARRQKPAQRWRQKLDSGSIRHNPEAT